MKYMGSKARIVNDIVPIMIKLMNDNGINTFVDAFCGGCSVIQNIPKKYHRVANDKQKYLIEMWKGVIKEEEYPLKIEREFYCDVRDSYNKKDGRYSDGLIGWVGFMASYNGRFFDGGYSGHCVSGKNGKTRDYISENIRNLMKQKDDMFDIDFRSDEYTDIDIPKHSLIYCDIPYKGTKQYATSKNFDYDKFYKWCKEMKNNDHIVVVSEYEMPSVFTCIWSKEITNAMHQTNTKKATEKLFILN